MHNAQSASGVGSENNARGGWTARVKLVLAKQSPLVILALLCIVFALSSENFRKPSNLVSLYQRTCTLGLLAAGEAVVIISGGIDLSVGSVAALSAVTAALAMKSFGGELPWAATFVGVAAGGLTGLLCGLINGLVITYARVTALIATLGMLMIARGLALILSDGKPIFGLPDPFAYLGGVRSWWPPAVIVLGIAVVITVALNYTRFGRHMYATGGNAVSARLSGVRVRRVSMGAYAISGLLAGIAGCVLASRTGIASPSAAEGDELLAVAACVIGGASLMGGEGSIFGALAGALIIYVLYNFCNLNDLDVYWQYVAVGFLLIILVGYDGWRRRKAGLLKEQA
jgi:ribose/xylose/arabinose/galactoside ABC-type transport system permease subunit